MNETARIRAAIESVTARTLDDEAAARLSATATWSWLVEPGDGDAGRLIAAIGPRSALDAVLAGAGYAPDGVELSRRDWTAALARWRPRMEARELLTSLETAARTGVRLIVPGDLQWPAALHDLGYHAPLCLWVRGDAAALSAASVAIVGARAATGYGEHVAMELSAELVGRGLAIVSGAAYGIDGVAHRAALAAGGTTVALLAGGVERPYPMGHAHLIDRITGAGAVVSEVPCGGAPTKWRFLQRNRLIAALARATIVVEAGWRSGSLNTAGHAGQLGRPLGAVPGPVTSAASAGCHRLLRESNAQCITNVDDVMELLGASAAPPPDPLWEDERPPTDDRVRVADALSVRSGRPVEEIARRSGLSVADAEALLGILALEELARHEDGLWRRMSAAARL